MRTIFGYFKPYKKQSVMGPLFKLLEATFELIVPFIVALIVDRGIGAEVNGAYPNADKPFIFAMFGVLVLLGVVGFLCSITAQYFAAKTATGISAHIRKDLFKKVQSLSYADLDKLGTSTVLTRMTGDIDKLQSGINLGLRLLLRSPFIVFGAMITALFIDPKSFGVFAVVIVALAVVVYGVMFLCMPLYKKAQSGLDQVTKSTRENLTGVRVLRAFCMEQKEEHSFAEKNETLTKRRKFVGRIAEITNPLTYVIVNLGIIVLLWTGAIRVDGGNLSQGSVIALYNLMSQILIELIKLANLIVTITKAAACGSRIESVLKTEPSIKDGTLPAQKRDDLPYVLYQGVSVRYQGGGENAIHGVDLSVEKGQTIGIIGGTGSGKTTLVNALPRFYEITEGELYVDGVSVKDYPLEQLRSFIGVVPQKAVLFKGTVKSNLAFGDKTADDEWLTACLEAAQAKEFVFEKGGLETPVEQGGKNFSGGQKQRLTIARALVKKPQILILDDSSSALDYATDRALRSAIKNLPFKPTVFVVSQRTSSVRNADKIVVLEDGAVVGVGTHETLLKECSVYREIYESQYGERGHV